MDKSENDLLNKNENIVQFEEFKFHSLFKIQRLNYNK